MMAILAKAAAWLAGPALVPVLALGGLWAAGSYVKAARESRDAAMISQGRKVCETEWEVAIAQQKQRVAEAAADAMRAQINATEVLNKELKSNAVSIERDMARVTAEAAVARTEASRLGTALNDLSTRCLSDSVLDMARGGVRGSGEGGPASKSPSRKAP